jgi:SAM-dependent methyltransferase
VTKRDDESGSINATSDMEAGMTTAERRRRRRGRGGLRVPSDNVPRRTTTPPVVAPVPEDPSLAMSIAYSFTSDGSEPVPRVSANEVPSFGDPQAPEAMSTVIDPPSSPVESADFEMKTREMSAVDLDALGLAEHAAPVSSGPAPSPGMMDASELQARFRGQVKPPRSTTEPSIEASAPEPAPPPPVQPVQLPPTVIKTQPMPTMRAATDPGEPATRQMRAATDPGTPPTPAPTPAPAQPRERLRTMALSDEDLLEVREAAARALTANPMVPQPTKPLTNATQPLSALDIEAADDKPEPISIADIDINDLADRADSSGEFDVDIDEQEPLKAVPQAASVTPPPAVPSADRRSRPPSVPPPAHLTSSGAPTPAATQAAGTAPHAAPHTAHAPPPPPPAHKAPPAPPPKAKANVAAVTPIAKPEAKTPRGKPWFVDLFDEDYLRTLPFLTPQATQSEAEFVIDAMGLQPGAQVLDIGCGYGRHAMELAARGFHVVGLDLSTPLLVRGGEEAMRRGLEINFVRGDMRELDFEAQFDAAYCMFSTFGYFDDETNKKTVTNIARALKPGGRMMLEILNRDYVIADLPTRVWWEGDGCVVLEEVELNYFSSRIQVNRSVVFDDGRQLEQEISVRAYSLHEVGKLMHAAGFRVLEVSGGYHTRGRFFGNQSRHIIVLAERKDSTSG